MFFKENAILAREPRWCSFKAVQKFAQNQALGSGACKIYSEEKNQEFVMKTMTPNTKGGEEAKKESKMLKLLIMIISFYITH